MAQTTTDNLDDSNVVSHKENRPISRGSTTSLQSVGVGAAFQPASQHHNQPQPQSRSQQQPIQPPPQGDTSMPLDPNAFYVQHGQHPVAAMYGPNPEEVLMHYQHIPQQHDMRPMSQQGFQEIQHYPMQYPHGLPQYAVPPPHMQHMRHHSEHFEGSPAPEDSNTEGGAKRRKGTASSMANDQELRRLLAQYQGKSLKEVAAEVQKNEGSGGKSEKAKQVFAMLWFVFPAST